MIQQTQVDKFTVVRTFIPDKKAKKKGIKSRIILSEARAEREAEALQEVSTKQEKANQKMLRCKYCKVRTSADNRKNMMKHIRICKEVNG